MPRKPVQWPRRMPVSTPERGPSTARKIVDREVAEQFVFGKTSFFKAPGGSGPEIFIPKGLGATLDIVRYSSALSIGSPHLPALVIEFGGRAAYRNLLTDSPIVLLVEPEGKVRLSLDIPPNTTVKLLENLVDSTTLLPITAYTMSVVVQYQIEGELWHP